MPFIESPLQRAIVGIFAVFLISAGVFVAFGGDTGASETKPIGENASEKYAQIDGVAATVTSEFEGPNTSEQSVMVTKERPGTQKLYQRTVDDSRNETEIYTNGSVMWLYDRDAGEAIRQELPEQMERSSRTQDQLDDIFARINEQRGAAEADDTDDTDRGVSPLPVVSSPQSTTASIETPAADETDYEVTYLGTGTVDERKTHVVRINGTLAAGNGSSLGMTNMTQTLWIDAERYFPLKYHQRWWMNGDRYETRVTYSNVTFDPGFDESTFEFDPPENVTVTEQSFPETTTYDSREALAEAAEMTVPDPDPPSGFEPETFRRLSGAYRSVSISYTNGPSELTVTKMNRTTSGGLSDAERVSVDGRTVQYTEFGSVQIAVWECGGRRYSVTGRNASRSAVLGVTASVDCERATDQARSDNEYAMNATPRS